MIDESPPAPGYDAFVPLELDPSIVETLRSGDRMLRWRRRIGYGLIGVASVLILLVGGFSISKLSTYEKPETQAVLFFQIARLTIHGLITTASIGFLYQVLRAAERMALPPSYSNNPKVARVLLGVADPIDATAKIVSKLAVALAKATELVNQRPRAQRRLPE